MIMKEREVVKLEAVASPVRVYAKGAYLRPRYYYKEAFPSSYFDLNAYAFLTIFVNTWYRIAGYKYPV